jgi:nicotinate-nucleotide pyrophosphorylase (carboxylating)
MLPLELLEDMLRAALREDLGTGDVTVRTLIPPGRWGRAEIIAREPLRVAGADLAFRVFTILHPAVRSVFRCPDGEDVGPDDRIMELEGPLDALLMGERVALNFFQHLCGVATLTRKFVEAVEGTGVKILDTRKTLPGLRILEKYAVRMGGGNNHRASLSEGVLVKENHILACGGIRNAVRRIRESLPQLLRVEVEATTPAEVEEALEAGADLILLDNMTAETIRAVVERVRGAVPLEVSGGVSLDNVRNLAETGVDGISVGRITHSAPGADLSMLVRHAWVQTAE